MCTQSFHKPGVEGQLYWRLGVKITWDESIRPGSGVPPEAVPTALAGSQRTMRSWAGPLPFLCLSFLVCKMV